MTGATNLERGWGLFMRLSVAVAVSCLLITSLSAAEQAAAAIRKQTNIAAQGLGPALKALARDREFQILYRTELVGERQTAGAVGEFTVDEALQKLLNGTNLTFQYLDDKTVTILPASANGSPGPAATPVETSPASTTPPTNESAAATRGKSFWDRLRLAQAAERSPAGNQLTSTSESAERPIQIEEVIVTAQKRSERLRDVPVPVSAISGDYLTDRNQLRLQDYYAKIPGLSFTVAGNGNEPVVSIRGVTTGTESNPTVGIVIDDVPYGGSVYTGGGPYAPDIDPGDLAHVEVLRGPQGTLYGASSIGGLLKFVTVDPSTDRLDGHLQIGSTRVAHGNDTGYSARGAMNVPLGEKLAVRLSGFTLEDPGYIDNTESGQKDVNTRDSDGGRLSVLWKTSDAFSLKLSAIVQDTKRGGTDDVDTLLGKDPQQAFLTGTGIYERKTEAYSATLIGNLGSVEMTAITGYSVDDVFDNVDSSTWFGGFLADTAAFLYPGVADRAVTLVDTHLKKFTQEIRASFPIGERVNWLMGAFYTDEDALNSFVNNAASSTDLNVGPLLANVNPTKFKEYAAFTNLTITVTDRFDVQIGGRVSENEQSSSSSNSGPFAAFVCGADPCVVDSPSTRDSAFTYLLTPRFKISPDLMLYARFASGYRPGGPNASCGAPGVPCSFDPDTTQNYDVGIKGETLGGRLSFDAAAYYIDWKDIQIPGLLAGAFAYTDNVGGAKSEGVELSIVSKPVTGLTVSAWGTYNEAELIGAFPPGSLAGSSGDRLPYGSRVSGSVAAEQEFALSSRATGLVGASLNYVGDRKGQFQPAGVPRETFPSYTQIDLHAGARFASWTVNAFVNNVTDERGVLRGGGDAVISDVASYFAYIQPRTVGVSLTKAFD
jgi:iron complex outermembrane recepter protein